MVDASISSSFRSSVLFTTVRFGALPFSNGVERQYRNSTRAIDRLPVGAIAEYPAHSFTFVGSLYNLCFYNPKPLVFTCELLLLTAPVFSARCCSCLYHVENITNCTGTLVSFT